MPNNYFLHIAYASFKIWGIALLTVCCLINYKSFLILDNVIPHFSCFIRTSCILFPFECLDPLILFMIYLLVAKDGLHGLSSVCVCVSGVVQSSKGVSMLLSIYTSFLYLCTCYFLWRYLWHQLHLILQKMLVIMCYLFFYLKHLSVLTDLHSHILVLSFFIMVLFINVDVSKF